MDDLDIYDDLDNVDNACDNHNGDECNLNDYAILQDVEERLTKENQKITSELSQTKDQLNRMIRANKILKRNISSLYKTARAELDRKNERISELTRQLDDMIFRRSDNPNHSDQRMIFKRIHEDNPRKTIANQHTEITEKKQKQEETVKEPEKSQVLEKPNTNQLKQDRNHQTNLDKTEDYRKIDENRINYSNDRYSKRHRDDRLPSRHTRENQEKLKDCDKNRRRYDRVFSKPYAK